MINNDSFCSIQRKNVFNKGQLAGLGEVAAQAMQDNLKVPGRPGGFTQLATDAGAGLVKVTMTRYDGYRSIPACWTEDMTC
jgi:hypothetical protein